MLYPAIVYLKMADGKHNICKYEKLYYVLLMQLKKMF